jgi:PmbA protein
MMDSAKRIVEAALNKGADEAEVFLLKGEGTGLSIERNNISSISGGLEQGIGIRVLKDKKLGFSYCTEESKAQEAISRALSISRLGKESDFTFPEPEKTNPVEKIFDDRIMKYSVEEALDAITGLVEVAVGVHPDIIVSRGGLGFGWGSFVVANSKGIEVESRGTSIGAGVYTVLKGDDMSTGFMDISSRVFNMDFDAIGREGTELAVKGQGARKVDTKEMDVVLTPDAAANLMEFLIAPALYGEAAHKGESVYSGKLDEGVAHESISIVDDGGLSGGLNSAAVDDEGASSRRTELISRGVLKGFLYSQGTALEYGVESTANAMRAERLSSSRNYKSSPTVKARNIVVEGEAQKVDALIGEVKEGVLVYDVLGAHTSNPASGDFSVNSSMLFKIESGEVVHPIKSAMLAGNFPEALKNVKGIGDDHKLVSGGLTPISFYIPSLSLEGIRVTG